MSRVRAFVAALALALGPLVVVAVPATPVAAVDCPLGAFGLSCPGMTIAVVGYIAIEHEATAGQPLSYQVYGMLSVPSEWSCSDSTLATGAYKVTCVPVVNTSSFVGYRCDVLHADVSTTNATGRARTSLDCDGQSPAEAQTATVTGVGGHDTVWAASATGVTEFSCTVDGGGTLPRSPDFVAGCGDPGLVYVS